MAVSHITIECKRYGCMKNLLACYANCRYNTRCEELRNEVTPRTEEAAKDINSYLTERGRSPIAIQFPKRGLKFIAAVASQDTLNKAKAPVSILPKLQRTKRPLPLPALKLAQRAATTGTARSKEVKEKEVKEKAIKEKVTAPAVRKAAKRKPGRRKSIKPPGDTLLKREGRTSRPAIMAKKVNNASSFGRELSAATPPGAQEGTSSKTVERASTAPRKKRASSGKTRQPGKSAKMFIILEGKTATIVDERALMQHLLSGASTTARYFEATEVEARVQIVQKR